MTLWEVKGYNTEVTVTEFLKDHVPFLSGLSQEEARSLAEIADQAVFKAGQPIIRQGTTVEALHVVATGKVSVSLKPVNKPVAQVAELGPGDVFGERSILEQGVAEASIKAVEESLVFVIPQEAFLKLIVANPSRKGFFLSHIEERRRRLEGNPAPEKPPAARSSSS